MDNSSVIQPYLSLMDEQRREIFALLESVDPTLIWQRPAPNHWSLGENLDHSWRALRSFRHLFMRAWILLSPIGRLRQDRSYPTEIDDVYARPGFPLNVGWMWSPKHTPSRPVALSVLRQEMEAEHKQVRQFIESKSEAVLGNTPLYDPAIGWMNFIEALRVGIYHDAHHFANIERILESLSTKFIE